MKTRTARFFKKKQAILAAGESITLTFNLYFW
jgi:hypothetical protein